MGFVLKALCVLTIPTMLVAFVVEARTGLVVAAVIFLVTWLAIEFGLLEMATDRAWPKHDESEEESP
ncbi:hypothetical protein IDH50_13365 [Aeromicrobium tamlense]|uniref:Uncharacterized protein n=1 Tax=Aeromicrobium tamlense TaxID=375541 RepID=A0A8I0G0D0_9ACTN|nr:hypothetical protein [Aeromicrobium tamlense]MBD1270641.1 hypothetical protein [Aeromicrobium tamlense]MBD1271227.1 hypothetical protein [Aeromicrobium tamlense]NYI38028.1 hypothetical protein [Aeromicrobium tamlense]